MLITDEYGTIRGVLTPIDILEAIAGEFPDEDEQPAIQPLAEGRWLVDGSTDLHMLEQTLGIDPLPVDHSEIVSAAGVLLAHLGSLPEPGARVELNGLAFEVKAVEERRIAEIEVALLEPVDELGEPA